ncbi:aminoacyltransferase [Patescibacteria group bacterium]|nr:aminoacyltransferase [Patescibacteria group bacterium]MBU2579714.1 aminoacyltransferase [Patescibacteria group bacterium]MBU4030896.1 aminoacyltransferase [Patescibacteria group bacterium]MBU4082383.1 aminoacyltransferase [Patescibacteria group bacterium]MCG2808805.1 aminoacyltransferase [Candidatus Portnoybacteria bacterium]
MKEEWNRFIIKNGGGFLQSYQWGEFQKAFGRKIWRVEIGNDLKALVIKHRLPLRRNYLYCPRGPVIQRTINLFLEKVREIGKREGSIFLKTEPFFNSKILGNDFIKSEKEIQPSRTIILDISKSEEDLLEQMSQKTRYNIRLSQRKGVIIKEAASDKALAINSFLKLLKKTTEKDGFRAHPEKYYQKMFDFLGKEGSVKLFLAKHRKKVVAAALFSFFGETAVYLHGASDYDARQLMAPHLIQWQAILEAKKNGLKYYDFGGIDEKKWPGVTRFKKGFGGQETVYPGAFDLIFKPWWYSVYNIARKVL